MKKTTSILTSVVLTATLIALIWSCFAPGFMSYDSMVQYKTAMVQDYSDSHPAIMSYVWRLCLFFFEGPQSLLILHLALLAAGILIWCRNIGWRAAALLLPLLFALPWTINFAGVLWKDVGMAFSLLVATGLLFSSHRSGRLALLSLLFLFYASAVRYNAVLAIVPLAFFGLRHLWPTRSLLLTAMLSLVFSAALPVTASFLSYQGLHAEKRHFETLLMGDEVARISLLSGENLMPWVKPADNALCSARHIMYERAMCFVRQGYHESGSLFHGKPVETAHALWKKTVLDHPLLYAQVKWEAFEYFLRAPSLEPYYPWHDGILENSQGIALDHPRMAQWLKTYVHAGMAGPFSELFKPYAWLLLAIAMLALAARLSPSPARTQVLALNASATGYLLGYLASVPSADFRYVYWCVIATTLSSVVWFGTIKKQRQDYSKIFRK